MALVSGGRSTLNPNAPLFIPSYVRQVEDFSPEWWNLVTTSTWFHDYWTRQHQGEEYGDDAFGFTGNDVADLLPENIDLDVDEDILNMEAQFEEFLQSSESEQQGIKSSPYGISGMLLFGIYLHYLTIIVMIVIEPQIYTRGFKSILIECHD